MAPFVSACHSGVQVVLPVPQEAGNAYRLSSVEPTYTTPFVTAGEEKMLLKVVADQSISRPETFEGLSTFSYGLTPLWRFPKRNCDQSVLTVNGAWAKDPE